MNEKLKKIIMEKRQAYDHVKDMTFNLLNLRTPFAFKYIWQAFKEYERQARREDRYIWRYARTHYSYLYVLMNNKTITDIYWALPQQMRQSWDAAPELKAWKEQYR